MRIKWYYTVSATLFLVIAVLHLVRAIQGWEAVVAGQPIPVWVSWAAAAVAGYLAFRGFQFRAKCVS